MFDGDVAELDAAGVLTSAAAHRAEIDRLEARLLVHAQVFADLHSADGLPTGGGEGRRPGRERGVVYGGAGCPAIAEFAPAEFGAMIGTSAGSAAAFIGQALALRHRLPRIWATVLNGEATPWKACKVATACLELSEEAAAMVDEQVAGLVDTVTPIRLGKIVTAARYRADQDAARSAAERKARERGVYVGRADDHGTKSVWILAATGDVLRFDATIDALAEALKTLGDPDPLRLRRARALGILADPAHAQAILTAGRTGTLPTSTPSEAAQPSATEVARPGDAATADVTTGVVACGQGERVEPWDVTPRADADRAPDAVAGAGQAATGVEAPTRQMVNADLAQLDGITGSRTSRTTIYVHLTDHTLATGHGVARVEGCGPLLAAQLTELIGHRPYSVRPVIDLNDTISVDAYEIPRRLREQLKLIHPVEQFPYGTAETTLATDLDHIQPYDPHGPPGQTGTTKLIPLRRYSHRVKTHGHWNVNRTTDDTLEWTSPHGFTFHVDHTGTRRTDSHQQRTTPRWIQHATDPDNPAAER
ncbi:hypothetical protein FB561_2457 [Kribbella amoyensis]|uniref:DUF222 domain-containing protein n=1 Tax=Kribbella amoyensis TaxID=996641 RepID=A0A561BR48_9ACTN|nr:hypothetical protein [Kribbella amoyensis]TWD81345.1 hypothetical protein FB561_2457 [Kribbella amoyensis]